MSVIGVIGPHAVGKTTALKRWKQRYGSHLEVYSLDSSRKEYPDNEDKQRLVRECQARSTVCVLESARGFAGWVSAFRSSDPVIVLTCPEPTGREWLTIRRKGRPMSDYWTARRLDYECNGHLLNYVRKLAAEQVKHFIVTDRERDWVEIDAYFYSLFRRLHNARR